ncbi:MAG: hypothetical protein JXB47_09135 [Anaerolineae bacterium]|nr:hypothetical protein [Anaerolineae bacterium]
MAAFDYDPIGDEAPAGAQRAAVLDLAHRALAGQINDLPACSLPNAQRIIDLFAPAETAQGVGSSLTIQ